MTQQEFEALQVGDVVDHYGCKLVVLSNNGREVRAAYRANDTFTVEIAKRLHVVSRVLSRENVAKGGA